MIILKSGLKKSLTLKDAVVVRDHTFKLGWFASTWTQFLLLRNYFFSDNVTENKITTKTKMFSQINNDNKENQNNYNNNKNDNMTMTMTLTMTMAITITMAVSVSVTVTVPMRTVTIAEPIVKVLMIVTIYCKQIVLLNITLQRRI